MLVLLSSASKFIKQVSKLELRPELKVKELKVIELKAIELRVIEFKAIELFGLELIRLKLMVVQACLRNYSGKCPELVCFQSDTYSYHSLIEYHLHCLGCCSLTSNPNLLLSLLIHWSTITALLVKLPFSCLQFLAKITMLTARG